MIDEKNSFLLYADTIHTVRKLSNHDAGELFKMILAYVNDEEVSTDNLLIDVAFEPIKQQLIRDYNKWIGTKSTRSDNGSLGNLKRYHPDLYTQVSENQLTLEDALVIAKGRKGSHSEISESQNSQGVAKLAVSVSDSVSVNDNDSVINNKGFDFFWNQYHDITSMPKTDKDPAFKHWKKLTDTERNLAIEKITDYYDSVENKKYVKKARTYLADKSFNDEHVNAEKKEEQYPDAVKMLAALGGYGPSIYPAIVKRLHEVQYKSEFGFDGILKVAVMAVENFGERGVNAYTWKAIESIDDPELRRDFRNRVKSHGYEAIHQRMVKKYLNEN